MKKLLIFTIGLFLSVVVTAQTQTAGNELPPLSTAREIGRAKSNLLNTKTLKKSSSKLALTANLRDFNKIE